MEPPSPTADVAPDHDEADHRHRQHMRTRRDVAEGELAARVGEHRSRQPLNLHAHVGQAQAGYPVDDVSDHRRPRLRADASGHRQQQHRGERGPGQRARHSVQTRTRSPLGLLSSISKPGPKRLEVFHRELLGPPHAVERAVAQRHLAVFPEADQPERHGESHELAGTRIVDRDVERLQLAGERGPAFSAELPAVAVLVGVDERHLALEARADGVKLLVGLRLVHELGRRRETLIRPEPGPGNHRHHYHHDDDGDAEADPEAAFGAFFHGSCRLRTPATTDSDSRLAVPKSEEPKSREFSSIDSSASTRPADRLARGPAPRRSARRRRRWRP